MLDVDKAIDVVLAVSIALARLEVLITARALERRRRERAERLLHDD